MYKIAEANTNNWLSDWIIILTVLSPLVQRPLFLRSHLCVPFYGKKILWGCKAQEYKNSFAKLQKEWRKKNIFFDVVVWIISTTKKERNKWFIFNKMLYLHFGLNQSVANLLNIIYGCRVVLFRNLLGGWHQQSKLQL